MASPGTAAFAFGGLCTVVFLVQLALQLKEGGGIAIMGGSTIAAFRAGAFLSSDDAFRAEPFRLLSSVFVHFGVLHFGLNMFGFVSQARVSEGLVGSARTMIAFAVTGVVGSLTTYLAHAVGGSASSLSAGASGGLLGVMGVILGVLLRRRDKSFLSQAGNVLFYVVLFGFAVNASQSSFAINNAAHLGGLLSGFVFGVAWGRTGTHEGPVARAGAALAFLASVASVALSLSSDLYLRL